MSEHEPTNTPDAPPPTSTDGFTARFSTGELPVAAHRYRLVWAAMCPDAQRAVIVRNLLGLDSVISLGEVDSVKGPLGWEFSLDADHLDPVLKIRYLSEAFRAADAGYSGRATVPALVDIATGKVVNNEERNLAGEFMTAWVPFHAPTAPNLYPESLREHIDAMNAVLYADLFGGVSLARDAESQEEYDAGVERVFTRLTDLNDMLSKARYLFGTQVTDSDIVLFTWLVRFDVSYYASQNINWRRLGEFPALWEYARDLYQTPGFAATTDFTAIKRAAALTDRDANPYGIVPKGPDTTGWSAPAQRVLLTPAHVHL